MIHCYRTSGRNNQSVSTPASTLTLAQVGDLLFNLYYLEIYHFIPVDSEKYHTKRQATEVQRYLLKQ